jgi:NAD(P)-dependent dehydrogenase (short-subunit alcohol dehydrogenase family)
VTKMADWEQLVSRTISNFGGLHVLVNNAGWSYKRTDSLNVTEQEYDRTCEYPDFPCCAET